MKINKAFLFTACAAIIWGATAPIMKLTLTQVPTFSLAFLRMTFASIIMMSLIYLFTRKTDKKLQIRKEDRSKFLFTALTGVTFNLTFFFTGLKLTQAINASFLTASVPVFTILAAHFYLKEKLGSRLIWATTIAFTGVVLIIGKPQNSTTFTQTLGNFLLLLATFSWVAHEILAKKLLRIYDAQTVTFYTLAIGAITFLPLALWEFFSNPLWINQVNLSGSLGLLYGILFSSLIAYWFWQKGLTLLPASQAAFFFYLDPISGTILAIILLGEKLTPQLIIGGFLIAIAVFLVEQKRHAHPLHR